MKRPNFLFIITDQQRWDHVGYAGNSTLKTPHIDSIAERGSWFERFYVASPVCMPNRATFMTGRMPSLHGVRHNGIPLDLDQTTFVDLLRTAGYRTGLVGKCHLQNFVGEAPGYTRDDLEPDAVPPPEQYREAWRQRYPASDYESEQRALWREQPHRSVRLPYYGFDDVSLCVGHGDNVSGHYEKWVGTYSGNAAGQFGPAHASATSQISSPQTYRPGRPEKLYPTAFVREHCMALLDEYADDDEQPFFIQCAFPDPHHPFTPPGKYWERYDGDDIKLPDSFYAESITEPIPPLSHLIEQYKQGANQSRWTSPFIACEAQAKEIVAKTYAQITMIDDAVGDILHALNENGLAHNTVVCFMSDHGDWMGDHGLFLKGPLHFQSLIRTPFAWRDPEQLYNRGRISALGGTLDLARTILTRAGLQTFNGVQGINLLPLLAGEHQEPRSMLIEQQTQHAYLGLDSPVRLNTLVDDRYRMTVWENRTWGELYDLEGDPDELDNLWHQDDAQQLRANLMQRLVHAMQSHQDKSPFPSDKG